MGEKDIPTKEMDILLVDDDSSEISLLKLMLEKGGYSNFDEVENGKLAVELMLDGYVPNLIILDTQMPIMGGFEAYQKIREMEKGKDIIIIGASRDPRYKDRWDEIGADGFLCKGNYNSYLSKIEEIITSVKKD